MTPSVLFNPICDLASVAHSSEWLRRFREFGGPDHIVLNLDDFESVAFDGEADVCVRDGLKVLGD